jgi:chaperonin GroES
MSIRVIGDKILVKNAASKAEGRNGIIVPDSVKANEHERAEVVAVGEGQYLSSGQCATPRVKVGEKLFYNRYAAVKVTHDGTDYLIITEADILFIEEGK